MSQVVFGGDRPGLEADTALIACFPNVAGLTPDAFAIEEWKGWTGTVMDRHVEFWTWRQLGDHVLMTEELLDEGDPDDAPTRTTHGVIAHVANSPMWFVGLSGEEAPIERPEETAASIVPIIEGVLRG